MVNIDYSHDYYADLDLSPTADEKEIRAQFRKLVFRYHPDRNPGREAEVKERFLRLQIAYEILVNVPTKIEYDNGHRAITAGAGVTPSAARANTSSSPSSARKKPVVKEFAMARRPAPTDEVPSKSRVPKFSESPRLWGKQTAKSSMSTSVDSRSLSALGPCRAATFLCEWEAPLLLEKLGNHIESSVSTLLADHLILVSQPQSNSLTQNLEIEATTLIEHLRKKTGDTGQDLLLDVAYCISDTTRNNSGMIFGPYLCPYVKRTRYTNTDIAVETWGTPDNTALLGIGEALAWLSGCLKRPLAGNIILSTVDIICSAAASFGVHEQSDTRHGKVWISPGSRDFPTPYHGCWQQLFGCGVVAMIQDSALDRGSHSPTRSPNHGKGLKISFDLLVRISAVEFPVNIGGKMVLVGYQTALFPIHLDEDYVQFHLEVSELDQINPYRLEQSAQSIDWDNNLISEFRKRDCYVGWCKSARVYLGTKNLYPSRMAFTDAPEKNRSLRFDGVSAGILAASTAPLQVGGSVQANFRLQTNRLSFTAPTIFSQMLRNTSMEMALLHDVDSKRSWIVPKLSLLLHMCHIWWAIYGDGEGANPVPYVEPYIGIGTVIEALDGQGDTAICGQGKDTLTLRTLLVGFNVNLLLCMQNTGAPRRREVYGFDVMEVVAEPGRGSCMRKSQLGTSSAAWLPLAKYVDAVVICAGIGDIICAHPSSAGNCNTIPKGRGCLAMPLWCLQTLRLRNGQKMPVALSISLRGPLLAISNNAYLYVGASLLQDCNHEGGKRDIEQGSCWDTPGKLQQITTSLEERLRSINKMGRRGEPPLPAEWDPFPESGAIAFG